MSGVEVVSGDSDGKLPPNDTGALFVIALGNVSKCKLIDGAGGRLEGKVGPGNEAVVKLEELVGNNGEGYSGKFEVGKLKAGMLEVGKFEDGKLGKFEVGKFDEGKFEAPAGKEALKPGYCIGCCIEGGINSPGGGLSKDCWCN